MIFVNHPALDKIKFFIKVLMAISDPRSRSKLVLSFVGYLS